MVLKTTELQAESVLSHLKGLGYPEGCISTNERQRLSGDWDRSYEILDPDSGQLLAVIGEIGAAASIESYAANLSVIADDRAVLLSESDDAGMMGFLAESGRDGSLTFFRVSFSGGKANSTEVEPISEFPPLARLKSRYKRRILSQQVMGATAMMRPRNRDSERKLSASQQKRG